MPVRPSTDRQTERVRSPPQQVLFVCTGNICRSPAAAALLTGGIGDLHVLSAGTRALAGAPVDLSTAAVLRDGGLDVSAHRATQLERHHVEQAALVLALTREHRTAVVRFVPGAVRRTFTLRELARLVPLVNGSPGAWSAGGVAADPAAPGARLLALAERAALIRRPHPVSPEGDDVADPYGQPRRAHERAVAEISQAVGALVEAVRTPA